MEYYTGKGRNGQDKQKKTCRKTQHAKIDMERDAPIIICCMAAVGENYNSTRDSIVLMQLGPVRYKDLSKVTSELEHKVLVQETGIGMDDSKSEYSTNELYDYLYVNLIRNVKVYKLHGGLKKKEREGIMAELQNLPECEKRVIIATSKYVGEGFDYPILDTLFLTLPISWSGRVKQYAGRLHRNYHEKKEIRIYDYLDQQIDLVMKMYRKRCKGYRSRGYEIMDLQKNKLEEQKK